MEQPIPQGCGVNGALQDLTFVPTSFFSACFPHMLLHFMSCFLEGSPEFIQVLFYHRTKEETEAPGGGFLGSRIFLREEQGPEFRASGSNSRTFSSTLQTVTNEIRKKNFLHFTVDCKKQIENQVFLHISTYIL